MTLSIEQKEKRFVTLTSVGAAILMTSMKIIVGYSTGSLGILSEAMHSGLDLVAAVMTYFAIRIADTPADSEHNYGHGKIENLSALFETLLLLITCIWIVWESIDRLTNVHPPIDVNFWSFFVIITSIIIDFSRSRALMKIAKKYHSQAIEADALHFSTDILSSGVVLIGLIGAIIGYHQADSIAALLVGVIVIFISFRIGRESINALIDTSPKISKDELVDISKEFNGITEVHNIRLRMSGSMLFVDLNIHVLPNISIANAHKIAHDYEQKILEKFPKSMVHIHIEPEESHEK